MGQMSPATLASLKKAALTATALGVAAYAMAAPGTFTVRDLAIALAPTLLAWAHVKRPGDVKADAS